MARVGLTVEHMRTAGGSKFKFQPGLGVVENATFAVEAMGAFTACGLRLTVQRLGKDLKPTEDEPITEFLPLANVSTRDGEPLFHPGNADGPDDEDPSDLGDENDTEGNALWAASEELKFDKNLGGSHFLLSLAEKGFKASHLTGYAPHLIGMVADFDQKMLSEGKAKEDGRKNPVTALIVKNILEFPYEKSGGGKGSNKAAVKAAPAKTSASKAKEAEPEVSEADDEVESYAMQCMTVIGEKLAGQTVTKSKVNTVLITALAKAKVPPKHQKAVQAKFADDEWFGEKAGDLGWTIDGKNVEVPE